MFQQSLRNQIDDSCYPNRLFKNKRSSDKIFLLLLLPRHNPYQSCSPEKREPLPTPTANRLTFTTLARTGRSPSASLSCPAIMPSHTDRPQKEAQ